MKKFKTLISYFKDDLPVDGAEKATAALFSDLDSVVLAEARDRSKSTMSVCSATGRPGSLFARVWYSVFYSILESFRGEDYTKPAVDFKALVLIAKHHSKQATEGEADELEETRRLFIEEILSQYLLTQEMEITTDVPKWNELFGAFYGVLKEESVVTEGDSITALFESRGVKLG